MDRCLSFEREDAGEPQCHRRRGAWRTAIILIAVGALAGAFFLGGAGSVERAVHASAHPSDVEGPLRAAAGVQPRRMKGDEEEDGDKESRAKAKRDPKDDGDKDESGTTSVTDAEGSDEDGESKTKSKSDAKDGDKKARAKANTDSKDSDEDNESKTKDGDRESRAKSKRDSKDEGDKDESGESKTKSKSDAKDEDDDKESRAKAKRDSKDEGDKDESGTKSVTDAEDSDEDSESKTKSKSDAKDDDKEPRAKAKRDSKDEGDKDESGTKSVTDAEDSDEDSESKTKSKSDAKDGDKESQAKAKRDSKDEGVKDESGTTSVTDAEDSDEDSESKTKSKSEAKDCDTQSKAKAKKNLKDEGDKDDSDEDSESKTKSKSDDKASRDLMDKNVSAVKCPACTPKKKSVPDVVIPFFERDLCKLKYTVKSILENDPNHNLGDVYLMWVSTKKHSEYKEDLSEVIKSIAGKGKRKVLLLDFSPQVLDSQFSGWFAQQVLKLKIASMVTSDHYLVMDAKNTIIREITPNMFFTPCHQAKLFTQFHYADIPKPHAQWYAASARKLNIESPGSLQTYWPASITPMVFHRETVLDLLAYIGEDSRVDTICSGPLCRMFGVYSTKQQDQDHATEFTMYIVFAYAQKSLKCAYSIEQKDLGGSSQMALSLWRGVEGNRRATIRNDLETVRNITKGILKPVMFGSQPSALDDMTPEDRQEAIKYLTTIYKDAKLFDPSQESADDLVNCVIGKY